MLQGYRTVIFNVIMGAFMIIRVAQPDFIVPDSDQLNEWLNAIDAGIAAVWTIGNLILRAVTKAPIFNRKKGA